MNHFSCPNCKNPMTTQSTRDAYQCSNCGSVKSAYEFLYTDLPSVNAEKQQIYNQTRKENS